MRIITLVAVLAMVTIGLAGALFLAGVRLNTSSSMPLGLFTDKPMAKGEYVIFCPPLQAEFKEAKQRGYIGSALCPGNYSYMMKKLLPSKAGRDSTLYFLSSIRSIFKHFADEIFSYV